MPSPLRLRARVRSAIGAAGNLARALRTSLGRVDVNRWRRVGREQPSWDARNEQIGRLVPEGSRVIDIGCGAQTLRRYIPASCTYQPVDVVAHDERVLVWNFNEQRRFPHEVQPFDVAVASGVIEYAADPGEFLRELHRLAPRAVLSYSAREDVPSIYDRRAAGWLVDIDRPAMERLFDLAGFDAREIGRWETQTIYELTRR